MDLLGIKIQNQTDQNLVLQSQYKDLSELDENKSRQLVVLQKERDDILNKLGIQKENQKDAARALEKLQQAYENLKQKRDETEQYLKYSTGGLMSIGISILAYYRSFAQ